MIGIFVLGQILLALGFVSACAEKAKVAPRAGQAGKSVAADGREGSSDGLERDSLPEKPLWTVANTQMKHECQPSAEMGFYPSKGLSQENGYMLARFAAIGSPAFKFEESYLQEFFKAAQFKAVKLFENQAKGVQGFVATSDKVNLVVFRGTHSAGGMVTDMNFLLAGDSLFNMQGGVHRGFMFAFDSVKPTINAALDTANRPGVPTYYVGHSLGGALAMLAASDGVANKVKVEGLITLGQPRTGNSTFSSNFSRAVGEKYLRYVHAKDLVPHLPPSSAAARTAASAFTQNNLVNLAVQGAGLLGFSHVGQLVHFDESGIISKTSSSDATWDSEFWMSNAETVKQTVTSWTGLTGSVASLNTLAKNNLIADHQLEKYLCQILKNVK